jgi:rhodanese-related sulfurtransferase
MGAIQKTIVELLLLGLLSVGLAFGSNAMRTSRSLKVSKNYFEKTAQAPVKPGEAAKHDVPLPKPPAQEQPKVAAKKLEHDYQEISFDEVVDAFNDPATKQGLNVFVDARKHEYYDEGHIPGALNCDPYEAEQTIDEVVAQASGVERVIVYCGGGDCEDSIFLSRELVEAGVPKDTIYLYPGGWTEWSAKKMPVEVGHDGHE